MVKKRESLFWADQIAKNVKSRVDESNVLKKIVKERGYIVYDEKTPSGKIHIGSGRGWIIHDVIAKAMRDAGLKAKFILSSDDIDPYDKPNRDLPKKFDKYLGMPFMDIPSPVKGYESFAEYYFKECTDKFDEYGIVAKLESTGKRYRDGDFDTSIKKILDNNDKVQDIYKRFYGKPLGRLPFNPQCEKCGKIGTTNAYEWDPEREVVKYRCEPNLVKWARGCGYEGEMSPYKGGGKLPWKAEWAAKWPTVGVVCELAGKDHFTRGGSRSISVAISDEVLDFPPPYPSTRKDTGKGYEFFTVGGKKMSTSKGMGVGFSEMTKYLPADMLRYLLVRTRPHARVDFDPFDENDIVLLYDRYDRTQRVYYGKEKTDHRDFEQEKRIYEFSVVGNISKRMPPQISLAYASSIVQIAPEMNDSLKILQRTGHITGKPTKEEIAYLEKRLGFAKQWVHNLAPEKYRFELQEEPGAQVPKGMRDAIRQVAGKMKARDMKEEELVDLFFNTCKESGVKPKEFFRTMYRILIGKDYGPRLAPFVLTIGRRKVARLLEGI
jgi:lysyl-tRNA synthetase class 1